MSEEIAVRTRMRPVAPPMSQKYEVRMVIWSTKSVRHREDHKLGSDPDQKIGVTVNFTGEPKKDETFFTDSAWFCAGGNAPWNYRMVLPISLPSKVAKSSRILIFKS